MPFSLLRRWLHRPPSLTTEVSPNPLRSAGPEEQFLNGLKFASGKENDQDYAQAAQCYSQAAEQGHCLAQFNLAMLYAQGQGVTKDEAKAAVWLAKAAELGNAAAQYRLGVQEHLACRKSRVETVSENRIEALKWVRLSAAQGYRAAAGACEFVALGMTREEVAESGRRAGAFTTRQELVGNPV